MKIISFSLWGNKPMYIFGALENIRLAKIIYPDWECRFYVDNSVDDKNISEIIKNGGKVYKIDGGLGDYWGMFWRFFVNDDPNMEMFISRDCDSRLGNRERAAVDEWTNSNKGFHTMHDHYAHRSVPALGGMWGAKKGCITDISSKIFKWGNYRHKGIDQEFLKYIIWPTVKDNSINHSSIDNSWTSSIPFPKYEESEIKVNYVGEIYDENNDAVVS